MSTFKRFAIILAMSCITGIIPLRPAAAEEETAGPEKLGLTFSLEYTSNYLWRGTYWYEDGAFFPGISYGIGDFTLSYTGEFSEDAVFDNKPVTKSDGTTKVRDLHATDFGLDFSHTFGEMVTIGAGAWYYLFHNETDLSYLTATVSMTLSGIPLSPFIAYNHDVYTGEGVKHKAEDFYIQAGISRSFELMEKVALNLGMAAGYYRAATTGQSGISDITSSACLNVTVQKATIYGGFNYVIVPGEDFRKLSNGKNDINRFYANTGVSYSL